MGEFYTLACFFPKQRRALFFRIVALRICFVKLLLVTTVPGSEDADGLIFNCKGASAGFIVLSAFVEKSIKTLYKI